MAALRAWVRRGLAQPLQRVRLTPEHELEWFAMALGDFDGIPWQPDRSPKEYGEQGQTTRAGVNSMKNSGGNPTTHSVMVTRRTLCELTGWQGQASAEALTLARAIKMTMDALSSYVPQGDFTWSLGARSAGHENKPPEFYWTRDVIVETLWKDIEAMISLRLYSVYSQKQPSQYGSKSTQTQRRKYYAQLRTTEKPVERGLRLIGPGTRALRRDLAWWMPPDAARILDIKEDENGTMVVENHRIVGYGGQQGIRVARYNGTEASLSPDNAYDCEIEESTLLASESYDSLELLYAQDMFTKFMQSVAEKMTRAIEGGSNLRPKDSSNMRAWKCFTLHNDRLSKIAQDIHNCGLGNIHQIYLSIIQPLSTEHKLPEPDSVITLARKHAKPHELLQHFAEPSEIYLWLFRTANTFPRKSSIFVKATAILMENLRTVTLTSKLREAQCYPEKKIHPIRMAKLDMEEELERVDRTLLICLMRLYKKQRRQWECDIIQGAGLTIEGHTIYPDPLNSTPAHRICQDDEDRDLYLIPQLAVRYLDWKDIHDCTPLHYAAVNGREFYVRSLLQFQPDVNARDLRDWTPLHYACNACSHLSVVQYLLDKGRPEVNAQGIDGVAPLHLAAMNGDIETVQILIRAGAALDIQDASGTTALHWAAFKGHEAIVEYLYEDSNEKLLDKNGRTALHLAAIAGKENVVRFLVPCSDEQTNADMDTFDRLGYNPLHWAAMRGHEAIVRYLVNEAGFNKDTTNPQGNTTLHLVASDMEGQEAIVRYLVGEAGANKEAKNNNGCTPLHNAVRSGNEAIVRYLVGEAGANKEAENNNLCTPLQIAVEHGNEAIVRYLISEASADTKAEDCDQQMLLKIAVKYGNEDIVQYLVAEAGANTEARDYYKWTPLHLAVEQENEAIVRYLIGEARADLEAKNEDQQTPLHLAVRQGNEAIVRYLIGEARADLEAKDEYQQTPLHLAVEQRNEAIVRYLISEAGGNLKARDILQQTLLHHAAMEGSEDIVRYLISEAGADLEAKDEYQQTPLHLAAMAGSRATVRYLVSKAGADLEAQDYKQQTPLHWAAYAGHEAVVRYLVGRAGANKEARDCFNKTPAHLAAERGHEDVVEYLNNIEDKKATKGAN
ncbi:ankyrin repeat protein [Metarhizium guizhouense ARSEF 977]|uniref:Ankyrin repeat protein n=1 Tax=Metarhizium guizhouense (strain ARSEF 977) TaxID=1276136 RepID=A0A0B4G6U4_METGA|nr:ankyrin repeat protein [Metarhizium guizhouense ARSEF 977]